MVVTTKHSDQKSPVSITKDLGVLAKQSTTVERQVEVPYIPLYVYALFGILVIIIFLMWLHKRSKKFRNFLKNF
jgi:prolipoprotein diacylglyceryltransferase